MTDAHDWLPDLSELASRPGPFVFPWPMPSNPGAIVSFADTSRWRDFVLSLSVQPTLPEIVRHKFYRAQKLYYLGWLDVDLIKAGEVVALAALELGLKDRYLSDVLASYRAGGKKPPKKIMLHELLVHMVEKDGLTNEKLPIYRRTGGNPVARILGEAKPSLAEIRNALAHGDPFDGLPQSGLLELVRDLVDYAYRGWIEEHARATGAA